VAYRSELALFALLLLACRLALVFCLADVFVYGEELEKGAVAKALLGGAGIPWTSLPYHLYEGGGFVQSHLDAFLFALMGPSVLALKLASLLWNLLILGMGWRLLDHHFGRWSARAFALLFILAPVSFQKLSLLSLGIHFEALFFLLAILHLGLLAASSPKVYLSDWFLLGLAVGFGAYFSYQIVPFAAWVGLALACCAWRAFNGSGGLIGFVGLLLGSVPWLVTFARWGPKLFDVHGSELGTSRTQVIENVRACLRSVFAGRDLLDLAALGLLFAAPLASLPLWFALRERAQRRALLWVFVCLVLFLAVYLGSGFAAGEIYHYFRLNRAAPAWLLASSIAAAALGWGLAARSLGLRVAAAALLALLALAGLHGTVRECSRGSPKNVAANVALLARTKGYSYGAYFARLWPRLTDDEVGRIRALRRIPETAPQLIDEGLAQAWSNAQAHSFEHIAELAAPRVESFVAGLGEYFEKQGAHTLEERSALALAAPTAWRAAALEAVGRYGQGHRNNTLSLAQEIEQGLALGLGEDYFRGLGWRLYRCSGPPPVGPYWRSGPTPFAFAPQAAEAFLERAHAQVRGWVSEGYARAVAAHTLP
jgi:hypothetical protein